MLHLLASLSLHIHPNSRLPGPPPEVMRELRRQRQEEQDDCIEECKEGYKKAIEDCADDHDAAEDADDLLACVRDEVNGLHRCVEDCRNP